MKLPVISLPAAFSTERLAKLVDAEKAALLRAKFSAWWEGEDFDADAFHAARATMHREARENRALAGKANTADTGDLFEAPLEPDTPRIVALSHIWGKGRSFPGADDEDDDPFRALPETGGAMALIGPGGISVVKAAARRHAGRILVFEWRDDVLATLKSQCARLEAGGRLAVQAFEIDSFLPAPETFDSLVSLDELTYAHRPQRFCQQLARTLKPNGVATLETYCRRADPDLRTAFSSSFAEPHLMTADALLEVFFEAGLRVDYQDDVSSDHLRQVRAGFRRLSAVLEAAPGLPPEISREIAWEAEAWRARVTLLNRREIERRLFVVSRMSP